MTWRHSATERQISRGCTKAVLREVAWIEKFSVPVFSHAASPRPNPLLNGRVTHQRAIEGSATCSDSDERFEEGAPPETSGTAVDRCRDG